MRTSGLNRKELLSKEFTKATFLKLSYLTKTKNLIETL